MSREKITISVSVYTERLRLYAREMRSSGLGLSAAQAPFLDQVADEMERLYRYAEALENDEPHGNEE